jgi:hypothetical protein
MHRRKQWLMAGLVVAGIGVTGCGATQADYGDAGQSGPAHVQPIAGTDLNRVILTSDAAARLGVRTIPVEAAVMPASSDGTVADPQTTVPVSAVIYDKNGKTWVYTVTRSLTYERQAVIVARVDGDSAVLRSGPRVGTQVVTVGSQELLGAELGVAGE